jgi:hypothetical protein
MHDRYYYGLKLEDVNVNQTPLSGDQLPCEWSAYLDDSTTLNSVRVWFRIVQCIVQTVLLLPAFVLIDTKHAPRSDRGMRNWCARHVARLTLFWSVPKVKYILHVQMSYVSFLVVFSMMVASDTHNPARSGDWGYSHNGMEVYTYVYLLAHSHSELHQIWKEVSMKWGSGEFTRSLYEEFSRHFGDSVWNLVDLAMMTLFAVLLPLRLYMFSLCDDDCDVDQDYCVCRVDSNVVGEATMANLGLTLGMSINIIVCLLVVCAWFRAYVVLLQNRKTGVLIIALTKMIDDIVVFMVIAIVLILGFAYGFMALYPTDKDRVGATIGKSIVFTTFAMFGEYDIEELESGNGFQVSKPPSRPPKLGQPQPSLAVFPPQCTRQLATCGPILKSNFENLLCAGRLRHADVRALPAHAGHPAGEPADRHDVAHLRRRPGRGAERVAGRAGAAAAGLHRQDPQRRGGATRMLSCGYSSANGVSALRSSCIVPRDAIDANQSTFILHDRQVPPFNLIRAVCVIPGHAARGAKAACGGSKSWLANKVRKMPSWPRSWANLSPL